jgi:tetratricopeptide (TPR) repeat protein
MRKHVIALLVLTLAVFLAYSNSLKSPWVMDDFLARETVEVSDFQSLLGFRKITYLTFLLNTMVLPLNPASLRFVNILIHILNVFLVYVLAYKTVLLWFRETEPKTNIHFPAFSVAFLSSSVFALHPMNINAVAYIIQRSASLATLFVLLSLLAYIRARQSTGNVQAFLFYGVSGIFIAIGIFSKENAVMAVPLIILYDLVFLSKLNTKELLKKLSIITGISFVIFVFVSYAWNLHTVIIELVGFFLQPNELLPLRGWMAVDVSWTPLQHILTEFRVLSRYLFLLILPLPHFLVFDLLGFPVSTGITIPITTLFSTIFVSGLILFSLVTLKRFPLFSFGMLWYFIAISLESFFALGSDLYFEHRNYLPLSGMVFWRNFVWEDSIILWKDTLKKNQFNYRAHYNIGNAYLREGSRDKAIEHYKRVIDLSSNFADAYVNLGVAYTSRGSMREVMELFQTAIDIKPDHPEAHYNLGKAYQLEGFLDKSIKHYKIAIDIKPKYPEAHINLGAAYHSQGLMDQAIQHYRIAIELNPDSRDAHFNLGKAYESMGLTEEGEKELAISERLGSKKYKKRDN